MSSAGMGLVVGFAFQLPEIFGHREASARLVLLLTEGDLVSGDLRQVLAAIGYCRRDGCETLTHVQFGAGRHRAAFDLLTQVQAVTVGIGGLRYAVGAEQHLLTSVLRVLTGFC